MITFEEFKKVDLRVGEVVEAEPVEDADNLLKLEVEADKKRQIIAGLRPDYAPDDLKGKQVVLVVNLEPKEIFGLKSEGMVLAVDSEEVSVLTTDKSVDTGSKIT